MTGSSDPQAAQPRALSLLRKAFHDQGGIKAAFAEARTAAHGGIRLVLDRMTEQFKMERQADHVFHVLQTGIGSSDWGSRVALVSAIMERCGRHLPPDIASQQPEHFVRNWQVVVRAYCNSLEPVKRLLRDM